MRFRAGSLWGAVLFGCAAVGGARAADWYTGAEPSGAGDDWIVAVDAAATVSSQGSRFANVTVTGAPVGTLRESGPRLRAEALTGRYEYDSSAGPTVHGTQHEAAALAGYEWVWRDAALAGFVGLNARTNELSRPDPANTVVGDTVGAKGVLEFYARPSERTMVQAYASYATSHNAYYARLRGGYALFGKAYIGPEIAVLGDDFFGQWRLGAHLTALHLGPVQVGVSAGYLSDRVLKGGVYTTLDVRAGF